jgi:hypothetical protein
VTFQKLLRNAVTHLTDIMTKVGIKYCGNCNPHIDSPAIVRNLEKSLPPDLLPLFFDNYPELDILIILCGCPKRCVDIPDVRRKAKHCLVVGGKTFQGATAINGDLCSILKEEINNLTKN